MRCCGCHCNCCCCIWIVIFLTWWFFDWNWIEIAFNLAETVFYYGGKIGWLLYWVWIFIVLGLNFAYQWFMNESLRRRRIYLHEDEDRFYIDITLMILAIVVAPMLVNWLLIARQIRIYFILPLLLSILFANLKNRRDEYSFLRRWILWTFVIAIVL